MLTNLAWRFGLSGQILGQVVSRTLQGPESEANPIERNCVYAFLYVCLIWSSLTHVSSESKPPHEHEAEDWWTFDVAIACEANPSTKSPFAAALPTNSCSTIDSPHITAHDVPHDINTSQAPARKRHRRSHIQGGNQRPKIHTCRLTCGQKFTTVGNRNKHERKDCPKLGDKRARACVRCQFCDKMMTRAHYAENGHRERCRKMRNETG